MFGWIGKVKYRVVATEQIISNRLWTYRQVDTASCRVNDQLLNSEMSILFSIQVNCQIHF